MDGILFDDVHTIFEHEDVTLDEPVNELIEDPIPVDNRVQCNIEPPGGPLKQKM